MSGYFIYVSGTSSKIRGWCAIETLKTTLCTANRLEHFEKQIIIRFGGYSHLKPQLYLTFLVVKWMAMLTKYNFLSMNTRSKNNFLNFFIFFFSSWQQRLHRPRQFRRAAVQRDGPGRGRQRPARPLVQERVQSSNLHVRA